jgi:hypothetical protein
VLKLGMRAMALVMSGAIVASTATMVLARGHTQGTVLDHQASAWTGGDVHLGKLNRWRTIPGFSLTACATGNVSASTTLQFTANGWFRVRVLVDGVQPLKPSAVGDISLPNSPLLITPTFVGTVPDGMHSFAVQWKVLNGVGGLTLHTGAVNLLYGQGTC